LVSQRDIIKEGGKLTEKRPDSKNLRGRETGWKRLGWTWPFRDKNVDLAKKLLKKKMRKRRGGGGKAYLETAL